MNPRIRKLLVANRGEIARRIMRTCHRMGIGTVAVFSDADEDAPFVHEADQAVRIGPAESAQSYLSIERIIDAARRTGADAIHPGYGFLAENADLAQACVDGGLIFVGPTPDAIRSMGSKQRAKRLVADAGVPVVPGYDGEDQADDVLAERAREIGFPVLIKASAGGGGRGMRIVQDDDALAGAIESARRESIGAFGDGTLLVEKYIDRPRHIEIQILGDSHGNLLHLFERECSIQRRHQKIVEECPSPALSAAMREHMGEAAVAVGRAIGYQNAGTVEFILAPDGSFYFLEVNTRLQVEHPVTEMVTGLDLVHEQLRIAWGEPLGYGQQDVAMEGAAIEVRLYAEDPGSDFLPMSGRIVDFHLPPEFGVRMDSGVETGSEVSIYYDPMLAKLVTHGSSRDEALSKMRRALRSLSLQGVRTNRRFLLDLLAHPEFVAGNLDTHFVDTHLRDVLESPPFGDAIRRAAVAATLAAQERRRLAMRGPRVPTGWRNNHCRDQWVEYEGPVGVIRVSYRNLGGGRFDVGVDGADRQTITLVLVDGPTLTTEDSEGLRCRSRVLFDGDRVFVHELDGSIELRLVPRFPVGARQDAVGGCVAPMPGKVIALRVQKGHRVEAGQVLLVMEAMKMEHSVTAPADGVVTALHVAVGEQVDADQLLAVVEGVTA